MLENNLITSQKMCSKLSACGWITRTHRSQIWTEPERLCWASSEKPSRVTFFFSDSLRFYFFWSYSQGSCFYVFSSISLSLPPTHQHHFSLASLIVIFFWAYGHSYLVFLYFKHILYFTPFLLWLAWLFIYASIRCSDMSDVTFLPHFHPPSFSIWWLPVCIFAICRQTVIWEMTFGRYCKS